MTKPLNMNDIPDSLMAAILQQVVDHKRAHEGKIHVVKASGKIIDNIDLRRNFAKQVISMRRDLGLKVVVVHGAGKQIDKALADAGKTSVKADGLRITNADHVEIIDRTTREANRLLCDMFGEVAGGDILPLGFSGHDNTLDMVSEPMDAAGDNYSGKKVLSLNPWRLLNHLENSKTVPIITNMCGVSTPVNSVTKINVNADAVASALAESLKAHRLLLCSDVPGVFRDTARTILIPEIKPEDVQKLEDDGTVTDGMLVKVKEALATAAKMGPNSAVVIMDDNFLMELLTEKGHGTILRAPKLAA